MFCDIDSPSRLFSCSNCKKSFARRSVLLWCLSTQNQFTNSLSDVLLRHQNTCKAKSNGDEVKTLLPKTDVKIGRKTACLRCARLKRGCSSEWPCLNCSIANAECTYPVDCHRAAHVTDASNRSYGIDTSQTNNGNIKCSPHPNNLKLEDNAQSIAEIVPTSNEEITTARIAVKKRKLTPGHGQVDQLSNTQLPDGQLSVTLWSPFGIAASDLEPVTSLNFLLGITRDSGITRSFGTEGLLRKLRNKTFRTISQCAIFKPSEQIDYVPVKGQLYEANLQSLPEYVSSETYIHSDNMKSFQVCCTPDTSTGQQIWQPIQSISLPTDLAPRIVSFESNSSHLNEYLENQALMIDQAIDDELGIKTTEIVDTIKRLASRMTPSVKHWTGWSTEVETSCFNFFSPDNLRTFLELYWFAWYPNTPVIHKPTFDPLQTPATLLAAMAIVGACHSNDQNDRNEAQRWFNAVEEMVFNDRYALDLMRGSYSTSISPIENKRCVQAIQAAYAVVVYQNWDGNTASKRRMRHLRFGAVVDVSQRYGYISRPRA